VWSEPPDDKGDEVLYFVSQRRRIKLKGHSFREFEQRVIPLLDGRNTSEEIERRVADVFAPADLAAGLDLLADQNLLEDAALDTLAPEVREPLAPQLGFFHELNENPTRLQARLLQSVVTILGAGSIGAETAATLAAARVGTIRCIDDQPVAATDTYLSQVFSRADVGANRADVVVRYVNDRVPEVSISALTGSIETEEQVQALVGGSHVVVCCLDAGRSSLIYKLNRACLKAGIQWTSCTLAGTEIILGPTVRPFETACFLCYKMRAVSCAGNPEDGFAFEQYLDRRKRDDSSRRENIVFGGGIAANFLGLETIKLLAGSNRASTMGRIVLLNLLDLTIGHHVVLRKPWCPACVGAGHVSGEERSDITVPNGEHAQR
jgi:bacteriocin biosynthesis cyclodehydratase domain-containing protein